jgi:hypothetical protein
MLSKPTDTYRGKGVIRAPEASFGELPVAPPVVMQSIRGGSGLLRNSCSSSRRLCDGIRRGDGGDGGGGARRSDRDERNDRVMEGIRKDARAEVPRSRGGGSTAPPHRGGGGCPVGMVHVVTPEEGLRCRRAGKERAFDIRLVKLSNGPGPN